MTHAENIGRHEIMENSIVFPVFLVFLVPTGPEDEITGNANF